MFKSLKIWWAKRTKRLAKAANKQNVAQREIVQKELAELIGKAKVEESEQDQSNREYVNRYNSRCPKCGASGQLDVVDKIRQVQGDGEVSGSFSLGFGSVYGSMEIDTNEVNHCNKCGNEWKKEKRRYTSHKKVIAEWLNELETHLEGKYTYAKRTVDKLQKFHAESIFALFDEADDDKLYYSTKSTVTLSALRTLFKSVFDENN